MAGGIAGVRSGYGVMNYTRLYGMGAQNTPVRARAAAPETPVQPVRPVLTATAKETQPAVYSESNPGSYSQYSMPVLPGSYAAEQANRSRVSYPQGQATAGESAQAQMPGQAKMVGQSQQANGMELPAWPGANAAEALVRMRIQYGAEPEQAQQQTGDVGTVGAQEAVEEGKCETCEKRKYQDGSDDSSVSYQTPTHIDADAAASAVRGHEMEHVSHEQAKAQKEDRKVVSQTVTLHTDICPECGKVYVSGGTTQTVTKANPEKPEQPQEEQQTPFAA